ncbi:MAG: J domain-containing protein [Planctomycetota bacterium]
MNAAELSVVDLAAGLWFGLIALGLPLAGWVFMGLDYRAYLRSLRRAIAVVRGYQLALPDWVRRQRPQCLIELDLKPECTPEEVYAAYRRRVKQVHPDLGGSERDFQRLQRWLAEALSIAEANSDNIATPTGAA